MAYTFEWFLNYILNLDEPLQLADKCFVLFTEGGLEASSSDRVSTGSTKQPIRSTTLNISTPHMPDFHN